MKTAIGGVAEQKPSHNFFILFFFFFDLLPLNLGETNRKFQMLYSLSSTRLQGLAVNESGFEELRTINVPARNARLQHICKYIIERYNTHDPR